MDETTLTLLVEKCRRRVSEVDHSDLNPLEEAVVQLANALQDKQPEFLAPALWIDEQYSVFKVPRKTLFGLVDASCSKGEIIQGTFTFNDAVEQWKIMSAKQTNPIDITGLHAGIIVTHDVLAREFEPAVGTFACPICGKYSPHTHDKVEVDLAAAFREEGHSYQSKEWKEAQERAAAIEKKWPPHEPLFRKPSALFIVDKQIKSTRKNTLMECAALCEKLDCAHKCSVGHEFADAIRKLDND